MDTIISNLTSIWICRFFFAPPKNPQVVGQSPVAPSFDRLALAAVTARREARVGKFSHDGFFWMFDGFLYGVRIFDGIKALVV